MTTAPSITQIESGNDVAVQRQMRRVPLNYWFGPKVILSVNLSVVVEKVAFDDFEEALPPPPDLQIAGDGSDGIYRPSEPLPKDAPTFSLSDKQIRYVEKRFQRGFIDLKEDFETYMSKFSGKTRSSLRRKIRKFEKLSGGSIDWSVYRTPDEMKAFHSLARKISVHTYQEKLFDAGIPDTKEFLDNMRQLAESDNVRGFILNLESKPISYLYLPVENGRVIYAYLGFNPSYSKHSPGSVLQLLALEFLVSEKKYKLFDFTEGDGTHKRMFSTLERHCGNVFYLQPTLRNHLFIRSHMFVHWLSERILSLVEKSGLKQKLRQLVRGQGNA